MQRNTESNKLCFNFSSEILALIYEARIGNIMKVKNLVNQPNK